MGKPRLIACMSVFNESENVKPCLDTVKNVVDGVHVVDGRFFGYPHPSKLSDDGTVAYVKDWCWENGKSFQVSFKADVRQRFKRTVYLQETEGADRDTWLFILDADNRFEDLGGFREKFDALAGKWDKRRGIPAHNYLSIVCDETKFMEGSRPFNKNLLLRWAPGLKYQPNHWIVSDAANKLYCATNKSDSPCLPGKVVNLPFARKDFKRFHEASLYRAVRLLMESGNWASNLFELGGEAEARYLDDSVELDRVIDALQVRIDREMKDFDIGMQHMLLWIKDRSRQHPPVLSEMERGKMIGLLYTFNQMPFPYD